MNTNEVLEEKIKRLEQALEIERSKKEFYMDLSNHYESKLFKGVSE